MSAGQRLGGGGESAPRGGGVVEQKDTFARNLGVRCLSHEGEGMGDVNAARTGTPSQLPQHWASSMS
jgi:hypothetical protein